MGCPSSVRAANASDGERLFGCAGAAAAAAAGAFLAAAVLSSARSCASPLGAQSKGSLQSEKRSSKSAKFQCAMAPTCINPVWWVCSQACQSIFQVCHRLSSTGDCLHERTAWTGTCRRRPAAIGPPWQRAAASRRPRCPPAPRSAAAIAAPHSRRLHSKSKPESVRQMLIDLMNPMNASCPCLSQHSSPSMHMPSGNRCGAPHASMQCR